MAVKNEEFNFLKIHTQFSICEGAIKIDDLADRCKLKKVKAAGIADSNNLCGALEFAEKLSKAGTQPIIGTQINILVESIIGKITLYATSEKGYKNLTKLSSSSYLKNKDKPEPFCDLSDLTRNNEDLILLTGNYKDLFGKLFSLNKLKLIDKTFENLKKNFENRIYIEIQRHNEPLELQFENHLFQISKRYELPLIAMQEVYYINQDMAEAHDALICIGEKQFIDDTNRLRYNNQHYIKSNEEIKKLYRDIPEALENNYTFPLRFNFKPKKSKPILPSISNDVEISIEEALKKQAKQGLEQRLRNFILKKNEKNKAGILKKNTKIDYFMN